MLALGTLVGDRFEAREVVGTGATSEVHRALDRSTGRLVALKVWTQRRGDWEVRFQREAELLLALRHPAIVELVASGIHEGLPFLALEWLEGEDLERRFARGPLSVGEVLTLGERVAGALGGAHASGIVHRDLKPSNIYLPGRRVEEAKLLDFGLAHVGDGPRFTRAGAVLGTPAYMAPEQARGADRVDARADVFALGCVLFEALVGRPPFSASSPLAVMAKILLEEPAKITTRRADVPSGLVALIEQMLAKEPGFRPRDGEAVRSALAAVRSSPEASGGNACPESRDSITHAEVLLLSVLFVAEIERGHDPQDERTPTIADADTGTSPLDRLHAEVLAHEGWAERLVDGTVVISLPGQLDSKTQIARSAECALALRAMFPDRPMALATGRGELSQGFPVGEVIERGGELLALARDIQARVDPPGGVLVDDVTANLLGKNFDFTRDRGVFELLGRARLKEIVSSRHPPFLGRSLELSRVMRVFESVRRERTAQALVMTGPRGIGKTRLADELEREYPLAKSVREDSPSER